MKPCPTCDAALDAVEEMHRDSMTNPMPSGAHPWEHFYVPFVKCGNPNCVRLREALEILTAAHRRGDEHVEAPR